MKKIVDFCERYSPEILVLLFCLPALLSIRDINSYHTCFYFTDYSTGFGGKKLLGELCSLWLPEVVRKRHLLPLIAIVNIVMIALFAWFSGKWIRKQKDYQFAYVVVLAVYLLSPYSFVGIISGACVDFYLCTATLCFLYLFLNYRGKWYYYVATVVILCVACLTHHIFCNIYFPLVFALFLYDIFTDEKNRKKNILLYSLITICLFLLFCAIAFFSTMNVDYETYRQYLQTRTQTIDALSWDSAIYYELYAKLPEHLEAYVKPIWKYNIARFVLTLIIFAPLFLMFWIPWILAIKNAQNKTEKWCYMLMQIALHVIILPAYIMAVDYQRWTYAYLFCQICLSGVLLYMNDTTFVLQCQKIIKFAQQHTAIFFLLAMYICSYPLVTTCAAAPIVDIICDMIGLCWQVNEVLPL